MNPIEDLLEADGAPIDDGIALIADLVAAVTWLRRGAMPGITIWDAVEQALRWRSGAEADWSEPDPLRAALRNALADAGAPMAQLLSEALRVWLDATAWSFNGGVGW